MDFSLIIPTYNRKEKLRQCLEAVFCQDYAAEDFEVLIVDDGSTDGTGEMLGKLSEDHKNLRYFFQPRKGPAAARNLGMAQAAGDLIGFTDDDCVLEEGWIRKMVQAHRADETATAIGGLTKVDVRDTRVCVSQFLSNGAIQTSIDGKKEVIFFPTCNVSLKKQHVKNEKFDEFFPLPAGEDLDFFWRLFKKGRKLVYRAEIEIFHDRRSDMRSFLRQSYWYGRGNYLVQHLHQDQPLLKELKTRDIRSFAVGTLVNFLKIPRFSYLCGRRLIATKQENRFVTRFQIYAYFTLHKISYLLGNIAECRRLRRASKGARGDKNKNEASRLHPEFIIFDITHRCNLRCRICEIRKDDTAKELTTDEVKNLISQAKEWGVGDFVLSGGEALLREDIFDIIEFAKQSSYRTLGILTNGITLDDALIKRLMPYLSKGELSLTISFDAMSADIHDDIRGVKGSHQKTLSALKILSGLKKNTPLLNFNVISIILNSNLEELRALVDFLKSLDASSLQLQPLLANNLVMSQRTHRVKYWIPPERFGLLDQVIDSLVAFKRQNPRLLRNSENNLRLAKKYFRNLLTSQDVACSHGAKTLLIANTGDVTTCFDCMGNVRGQTLEALYASQEAGRARERVRACKNPCLLPCFCDS